MTLRGVGIVALLVALAAAAAGCTSEGRTAGTQSPPPSGGDTGTPVISATAYSYARGGVSAKLRYTPGGGVLTVTNNSGGDLPAPGLYLLRAEDGGRVEGRLSPARPLPEGATRTYQVTFATALPPRNVGLIVLLIGRDNYGALIPPTG